MWPGCPPGEAAQGLRACESGPASLAEMRAAASARAASEKQSRDWTGRSPRCLAVFFFNILGLFPALSAACWRLGRGGRSLATGPWPLRAGRARPAGLRGRRGCSNGRLLPHPQWREHTQAFSPAFRLLGVGLVLSVLSEGRWGGEWTASLGSGLCWRVLTAVPVGPRPSSAPSWPPLLVLWGPAAQPCVAGRGGS